MKRICVVTSSVPFVTGGNELLAQTLVRQLECFGHRAQLVVVPQNRFGKQISGYVAARLTDVEFTGCDNSVDQIISLKFPSFAVRHPVHVCWFNHRMREYYDLWDRFSRTLPTKTLAKELVRRMILRSIDTRLLKTNVRKVFAQSDNIRQRLMRFGNIPSEVLYPPASDLVTVERVDYEDFILSPSRLVELKRHDLLIRALAQLKSDKLRLVVAGAGPQEAELMSLVEQLGLERRVEFTGEMSYEMLSDYYQRCLAVFYGPYDEDYGLVTLEANKCHKCVITCTDSGGPNELVAHCETGLMAEPTETALADALGRLDKRPDLARDLGEAAYDLSRNYTWELAIERLTNVS